MVQNDVTELVVEIVNVLDILERGRLRKNIVLAERQRIAADTVIIVPQQKILCFGFILDGKARERRISICSSIVLKSLSAMKNLLYKQNAPKCAYAMRRGLGELLPL